MFRSDGDVAIVTGAAGGLGAALGAALAERGFTVIGVDIVRSPGVTEVLDVTDEQACRSLAQRHRPQLWVNNAGILAAGNARTQELDEVRRCLAVNLMGTIHGSRAAAEVMTLRGSGRILNIGSFASWVPVPGETVYAATKHAVRAFTIGLAAELQGTGVRAQLLSPDGIWTPMLHDRLGDPHAAMSFTAHRLLEADEVARAALALLDSGSLLRSVPRFRGAQVRLLGAAPGVWLRLLPLLRRVGALNQRKLRRRQLRSAAPQKIGAKV
jgi:short-subunit dehydrogenase